MAVIQKYGKNYSPDLVCHKDNHPSAKIGDPGFHKKWPEHNTSWSRPVARVWTVVLLLGTCLLYCARVAMPICAVSMAEQFGWSKRESGMVLGSFFWGYCFTQVFGGYVSDRVGGEKVLLLSAAAWGSMTAFTPILAHFCSQPILSMTLARFLMGLLQGLGCRASSLRRYTQNPPCPNHHLELFWGGHQGFPKLAKSHNLSSMSLACPEISSTWDMPETHYLGGILNQFNWLLLIWKSSSSTLSTCLMTELLTPFLRESPDNLQRMLITQILWP